MTNIYTPTTENIAKAAEIIKNGGLVAMPTETVYGLGANVYDPLAVAKIFKAKNRPNFNPLISHIADIDFLQSYAKTDERAIALAKKFWPGALTIVLNRSEEKQSIDLACAGLKTVSVRMPNHQIALELIKKSGVPIVAPSANLSTTISPTTALHVFESLGNNVDMILDGGPCSVGVESTIIDLTSKHTVLLRAGGIANEDIEKFLGEKLIISQGNPDAPSSPGQMLKHYAPNKKLRISALNPQKDELFIGFGKIDAPMNLSQNEDLCEAAANLFAFLRLADKNSQYHKIAIAPIPNHGLGLAINDRLKRAAHI